MADTKEHWISAHCFINGLVQKLGYDRKDIRFITQDKVTEVFNLTHTALTDNDLTGDITGAALIDDSYFTSQYGVIFPLKNGTLNKYLLFFLTVSYIWKVRQDDIEFYVDNVKEPYLIHSNYIIKYIENSEFDLNKFENVFFDLSTHGDLYIPIKNFYDNLEQKIKVNEIKDSPFTLNGHKVGRIMFLSDTR